MHIDQDGALWRMVTHFLMSDRRELFDALRVQDARAYTPPMRSDLAQLAADQYEIADALATRRLLRSKPKPPKWPARAFCLDCLGKRLNDPSPRLSRPQRLWRKKNRTSSMERWRC
jgi:hypothetical protein